MHFLLFNLMSLYYDIIIMWYIIIKLILVYWSLYKILKEYSWNTFNKQEGFFHFLLKSSIKYIKNLIIKKNILWNF